MKQKMILTAVAAIVCMLCVNVGAAMAGGVLGIDLESRCLKDQQNVESWWILVRQANPKNPASNGVEDTFGRMLREFKAKCEQTPAWKANSNFYQALLDKYSPVASSDTTTTPAQSSLTTGATLPGSIWPESPNN